MPALQPRAHELQLCPLPYLRLFDRESSQKRKSNRLSRKARASCRSCEEDFAPSLPRMLLAAHLRESLVTLTSVYPAFGHSKSTRRTRSNPRRSKTTTQSSLRTPISERSLTNLQSSNSWPQ